MTAEQFRELEYLSNVTRDLKAQLRDCQNASFVSAVNYSGASAGSGTGDPVGRMAISTADADREINRNIHRMHKLIDTEPKPDMRQLLRFRLVYCLSWRQIAARMYYEDGAAVYRRFKRYERKMTTDMTTPNGVK